MGAGVWPPHSPGFLLVGDAAARVDPASGEGIAYALETGQMAASHVDEALVRGSSPSLEGYTEEVRATYAGYFGLGRGLLRWSVARCSLYLRSPAPCFRRQASPSP